MVKTGYDQLSSGSTMQRTAASRLDVTVPATAPHVTAVRGTFRRWVDSFLTDDAADDLTLAVYEALANAAEHAFTAPSAPGLIWLHAIVAEGQITVTVTDNGTWRYSSNSGGHRGRGLPLIHRFTSEAHIAPSPYGTTVRLRHQLHAHGYDRFGRAS
jgi:anti-sigma regulatory factor (Ser/Thr protein kinase)